ncbi:sulfotransferase family 2 domain-containing protein [Leptolyngbya sp. CCY15150]|uniref:sulfotransferase family 2 domain-containing protein n=1 Tax=Leptolyngbya sp. CCY15150 TaxID=2767772 RepID=UPI0019514971|nr:sulfotransferase family 2 domain-containing protein [Leptolyngbya sp. CCY15150]
MIVSHKHKFVFIKTAKTAGTSIEIALSKFCGDDDIITPIIPEDEELRKSLGYRTAQNYTTIEGEDIRPHISARRVRRLISRRVWDQYYTFCFERNPWDKIVSLYYYRFQKEPRPSINDFIKSEHNKRFRRKGFDLYTIKGSIVVDRVCLYESLEEHLRDVLHNKLGIQESIELPRAKGNLRPANTSYQELLDPESVDIITRLFSEEIQLFGYQF